MLYNRWQCLLSSSMWKHSALKILHAQILTLVIITGCFDKIDSRLSVIVMNSVVLMSVITFDCQAVEGERSAPKDGQITTFMKMAEEEEETLTKTTAATNQQAAHGQQQQQQQANNNEATITTAINQTTTTPPSSSSVISSSFNPKIKVHLVAVGSAPILKKNKFLMNRTDNFGVAISFLRKRLKLNNNTNTTATNTTATNTTTPFSSSGSASSAVSSNVVQSSSLFLYVNSAFVPSPTEQIGDLYDCFGMRDELVIHYSLQEAWGWKIYRIIFVFWRVWWMNERKKVGDGWWNK